MRATVAPPPCSARPRGVWPDRWDRRIRQPVLRASRVGDDRGGRTDIGGRDRLRLRLTVKHRQPQRLAGQLLPLGACAAPRHARA